MFAVSANRGIEGGVGIDDVSLDSEFGCRGLCFSNRIKSCALMF